MPGFGRLQAALYDPLMRGAERGFLGKLRDDLIGRARGETLEVGAGTGANVARYREVDRVVLSEPEPAMVHRLRTKLSTATVPVAVEEASAEALPFPDDSFDTVVSTLVMCTVADPGRALREVRRVLRPGGRYLFLEHGGSEDENLARWQRRLDPIWKHLAGGCHLSRHAPRLVTDAGFTIAELEVHEPKRTGPIKPFRLGVAT
jgi:ubiquinone/menaquinone biosynthesis C-methylase UbiE